uniref:Uncharacterized protein n=1 Tax=Tetranychus urticae TaxID=32264 RepID=T1KES2_TETUR
MQILSFSSSLNPYKHTQKTHTNTHSHTQANIHSLFIFDMVINMLQESTDCDYILITFIV